MEIAVPRDMTKKQSSESPSAWMGNAQATIRAKVKATPAYAEGRAEVLRLALDSIGQNPTVDHLRALGGITAVLHASVALAKTPGLDVDHGSKMFPLTAREVLTQEASSMRAEVQHVLAYGVTS